MRKLYTLAAAILTATAITAQVNVTFKVDVTNYIASTPLGANGVRIGGNFATTGGTNGANAMIDWNPGDANSAMVNESGTNIWAITVTYPSSAAGTTQLYKFVNNDWGTNEGTDAANTIGADGCGTDDGAGNVNRTLVIPSSDITLIYCWDRCLQCDGSPAGFELVNSTSTFNVFPNPANEIANVNYNVTAPSAVSIEVYNALGQRVLVNNLGEMLPGAYQHTMNTNNIEAGIYFVKLNVGGKTSTTRLSIVK